MGLSSGHECSKVSRKRGVFGSETWSFSGGGYELAAGKPNPQIEPGSRNNKYNNGIYIYI